MTQLATVDRMLSKTSVTPLWWRLPAWAALTIASVVQTHDTAARIATAALMIVAATALQFASAERAGLRVAAILISTIGGLAACYTASQGLAEVLVVVAASRAPYAFEGWHLRWFTVLDTIAFGLTVGYITHSLPGLLAGTGIPLLVQRAIEQRDLVRERDRAQALLVEVQAGREAETQAAALRERSRIAREMHDVLAHTLAGLSVQLQAVRALAAREGVSKTLLDPIDKAATLARDGLGEARATVSTLRDPVGLGLDDVPALVSRHPGDAGLTETGEPRSVSPEAGHVVYRAVQEALTNTARYAPGSPVAITLQWGDDVLEVSVVDRGPAPGREAVTGQGTGLGLAGMGERASEVGGSVRAGAEHGGWRVAVRVPALAVKEVPT